MRYSRLFALLGVFTLLGLFNAGSAMAQTHIPPEMWQILGPITQPFGAGPTNAAIAGDWTSPNAINDDPAIGDEWDIDFDATLGTGFGGTALAEVPTWFTYEALEAELELAAGTIPRNASGIDAQQLFSWLQANVAGPNGLPGIPNDNVMFIAKTYVENLTGDLYPVQVCTSSDDSIAVYINNVLVSNVSAPRGWGGGGCQEVNNGCLLPGVNSITMMVWEGGGGWGGRTSLRRADGSDIPTAGDPDVAFLGPEGEGQVVYSSSRSIESLDFGRPGAPGELIEVTVTGAGDDGADETPVTVVETLTASTNVHTDITVDGADVTDIFGPSDADGANGALGLWGDTRTIGADAGGGSGTTDEGGDQYINTSTTGGDIWTGGDRFHYDFLRTTGDFDFVIRYDDRSNDVAGRSRWGKFGIMARKSLHTDSRFTMAQGTIHTNTENAGENDSDRQAGRTQHRNAGGGMYEDGLPDHNARDDLGHPAYARLTRRGNVIRAWFSDDAAVEGDPTNDALWPNAGREDDWGGDADGQDIYVGFGNSDHGDGGANNQAITYTVLNADYTAAANLFDPAPVIRKEIRIETTRGALNEGISYSVSLETPGSVNISGDLEGECGGVSGQNRASYANQSGPVGAFENSLDVGGPAVQGSTTFNPEDNSYTVVGQGADIWNGGDQFQFAYKGFTGDFVATARIRHRGPNPSGRWGKHGIMARQSLDFNSRYSMAMTPTANTNGDPNAQDFSAHQLRVNHLTNGSSNDQHRPPAIFDPDPDFDGTRMHPAWQRLIRKGQHFSVFFANDRDGAPGPWIPAGGYTHPDMPATILLGYAQTSHGALATTHEIDNWSVTVPTEAPPADHFSPVALDNASFDFEAAPADLVVNSNNPGAFLPQIVEIEEGNSRLRMLEDGVNSLGTTAWLPAPTLTDGTSLGDAGFRASFDAYFTGLDGDGNPIPAPSNKADGVTFAVIEAGLQDATGLFGGAGGAMGFAGGAMLTHTDTNEAQSLAIELDTWGSGFGGGDSFTGGTNNEPGRWHFGADASTSVVSVQNSGQFTGDGTTAGVPAAWDPATGGAHVEVQYLPIGDGMANVKVWASSNDDPASYPRKLVLDTCMPALTGDLLFGFTGGSGGANMRFEVDNLNISSFCVEAPDSLTIEGDTELEPGQDFNLTAVLAGADGEASYQWIVLNGPGEIVGANNEAGVVIASAEAGDSIVRAFAEDELCGNREVVNYTVTWACPAEGDTTVDSVEVAAPNEEGHPGDYTVTASATDAGGDDVSYSFSVTDSEGNEVASAGPQAEGVAVLTISEPGDYNVTVSADDSAACDDPAGESTVAITVNAPGGNQLPGDTNQDGNKDISDEIVLIGHLFLGDPATLPCGDGTVQDGANIFILDHNGDGAVDVSDVIAGLAFLFLGDVPHANGTNCVPVPGCPDVSPCNDIQL